MTKNNILIIDDNPKNIQLAATVLKTTNLYNIFFATSGQDGLNQLYKTKFSLVLLDINMPIMNGYETAQRIKNDEILKKIPIIFLSANATQESINQGFEYGGADYITKPFQEEELLHRVRTHVELFNSKEQLQNKVEDSQFLLQQYKVAMDAGSIVSKTDLKGVITYVNDKFCEISKYSREELLGANHNILRHHNMPAEAFEEMWSTIKNKDVWKGFIENRAKDGSSYFVEATVLPLLNHDNEIVEYMAVRTDITKQVVMQRSIIDSQKEILFTFGELGEMRSKETGEHVKRVALYSEVLSKAYGCNKKNVALIKIASPMHDIGKVIIPDSVLLKPGKLNDEEFMLMKQHAVYGYDIFKNSSNEILQTVATIAHEHHEKWDGSGYPRGLKGEEISILGRIVAIADVFDALSHDRVYKKAWSIEETMSHINRESGVSFEPKLVELFVANLDEILEIKQKYSR